MTIARSYTYRIGEGATKTFTAMGPTKRADGSALPKDQISHYVRYLEYTDENGKKQPVTQQKVKLVEDANTPEYDGSFDEVVDIDSVAAPGRYLYWYRTVDTLGLESDDSPAVELIVQPAWSAPWPLPPDVS